MIHPKVGAGGVVGALTILIVWLISLFGATVPAEVASAMTVVLGSLASYMTPNELRRPVGGRRAPAS